MQGSSTSMEKSQERDSSHMSTLSENCRPSNRCGRWRVCQHCAKIRQSKIADEAERMERIHGPLWLSVAKPHENTAVAIRKIRAHIIRNTLTGTGIWTIETGEKFAGLHLNLITPSPVRISSRLGTSWSELITNGARVAASYISKQEGMPELCQYEGRLYGTFGKMADILISEKMPATVQAASIETIVRPPGGRLTAAERRTIDQIQSRPSQKTMEEYKEIARKHLPHIFEILK